MKRLMIALSAAAVLIAAAPAWAHEKGRGHHGYHFKPQHHGGYVHRPHFKPHFGHHFRPHHYVSRFYAPGHGARVIVLPKHGRHARPHHNPGFRDDYRRDHRRDDRDGHRRSWR